LIIGNCSLFIGYFWKIANEQLPIINADRISVNILRMKIRFVTCILFLFASQAIAADKWATVRSANFTLVGNATDAQIRAVGVELEQFRDAFAEALHVTVRGASIPTTVFVFKNDETFNSFKPLGPDGKPAAVSGYFQQSEEANYLSVTSGGPIPRAVYHEYAHELIRELPNPIPLWLNEGLADFFSNFEILPKEKQFAVGKSIPDYVETLRKGSLMPLDDLFRVDRSSPHYNERNRRETFHAESWALVNYLMVGANAGHQADLSQFLMLVLSGKPVTESFQTAFKSDARSMQGDLDRYLRDRSAWQARGIALKDKAVIEKDMRSHGLSDAEGEYYAGDLLVHINRWAEAEAHLKQSTTLDPKLGAALAATGMLQYRQDRLPEAIELLKRSVEADPKNYLAQYEYACVLDKNSTSALDDLDAKRGALGKAIELMPQYAPAYELLAYINITADIDYNGTIDLLQTAGKYAPGNTNLRFLLAQALVKKENLDQADAILQSLANNVLIEESIRDGARNLISYIARVRETKTLRVEEEPVKETRSAPPPEHVQPAPSAGSPAAGPVAAAPPGPRPKSGELVAVTPVRPKAEGPQIKGMLILVDCRGGLTLTVKSASETLKLHSDTPEKIQFVSYVPAVSTSISCGPVPGQGLPVIVTYRLTPDGSAAGEPIVVEFFEP